MRTKSTMQIDSIQGKEKENLRQQEEATEGSLAAVMVWRHDTECYNHPV